MTLVHSHVNAKKAEHELLALFTEISIVNRYDLFFNLTQETQYFTVTDAAGIWKKTKHSRK